MPDVGASIRPRRTIVEDIVLAESAHPLGLFKDIPLLPEFEDKVVVFRKIDRVWGGLKRLGLHIG